MTDDSAGTRDVDEIGSFTIPVADVVQVVGERVRLPQEPPLRWARGVPLAGLMGGRTVPAPDRLLPAEVRVRAGDRELALGTDYLLDARWGTLGLAPASRLTAGETVEVDYAFSLARVDSVVLDKGERIIYRRGSSALAAPVPPRARPGERVVATAFVVHGDDGPLVDVFPVAEPAEEARTRTTPGRLPRTLAKLRRGEPATIVCWGDSVTVGGDASAGHRYVDVFARRLTSTFREARVSVHTVAVGGSSSVHWVEPDKYRHPVPEWQDLCDWRRIVDLDPDAVTVEFVNDCHLDEAKVVETYSEILDRLARLGAEVVLVTPHFTEPEMMGMADLRGNDDRPYVRLLHQLADTHGVAIADASARWGHLWREGLPYTTLLANGINHPDDRGHAIFADELMKCFA